MADEHVHVTETSRGDGGTGFFLGIILLIVFLLLFFYYGLPLMRGSGGGGGTGGAPQINVPDKMDVNVQQK